jgi:RecB family exonuclease
VTDKPQTDLQNYGLQLQTPEASNRDALQGVPHPVPAEGPKEIGNAVADHAARMATVEWIRNGGTFVRPEASGDVEDDSTLQDIIARDWEAIPRSLRPYLGDASTTAVAALPANATLSVTGGFEPLSHCLFQAYLKTRLRLKEPDTLEEELNAREVGSAVHKALENIGIDPRWRPDAQQQESAVQSLTLDLSKEVTAQLETMLTKLPVVTPALEKARKGLGGRWERHLAMYVRSRVEDLQALGEKASKKSWSQFGTTLEYKELLGHRDAFFAVEAHKGHAKEWIRKAVEAILATTDPLGEETLVHCNSKSKPVVQQWISDPDVQARVHALAGIYASLLARESSIRGAVVGGKAEWKFGPLPDGEPAAPLMLQLGDTRDVLVRGSVDRVRVTEGSGGIRAVELLDYKTGRPFLRQVKEEIQAGTRPQLPLYALALLAARGFGKAPPDVPMEPVVLRLAYDFVQDVSNDGLFSWEPGDSSPSLEESAHLLGWLLALARSGQYPVLPHPLTCPVLKYRGHDYCPFRPACRFGQHPGTIVPTDDEPSEEVAE